MDILTIISALFAANAIIAVLVHFSANYRRHIQHSWPGRYQPTRYSRYLYISWLAFAVAAAITLYIKSIQ